MGREGGRNSGAELAGHVTAGTSIKNILNALTSSSLENPEYDLNVKMRSSGQVVYSMRLTGGVAADEGLRGIEQELKTLGLEEFCKRNDIKLPQ